MNRRILSSVLAAIALAVFVHAQSAGPKVYVTPAAAALVEQGLALAAPTDATGFQSVTAPSLRNNPSAGFAQVTLAPWVESNGWRYQRGLRQAAYMKVPPGVAGLAAAEAFAFNADAILEPEAADLPELGNVLKFLKAQAQPALPVMANLGVIDDGSPAVGELMNLLTRRNLLYRVVPRAEKGLDFTIQVGSKEFPAESLANPSDFAERVREKLTDDKRLVRVYGTQTVVARLTGAGKRARLYLLSYSRNRLQQDVRIRLLGNYQPTGAALYGAPADAKLVDVGHPGKATEFGIASFNTIAIIDLVLN